MDQWAPLLLGYQAHEQRSETESSWTLKGDLGALSRTVEFRVQITEWAERERVRFVLEGVVEPVRGEGSFRIEALDAVRAPAPSTPGAARTPGLLVRLWANVLRWLLGRRRDPAGGAASRSTQPPAVRLTFHLSLTPVGPMAPMLDAMLAPVMVATAQDLAQRIVARLESGA